MFACFAACFAFSGFWDLWIRRFVRRITDLLCVKILYTDWVDNNFRAASAVRQSVKPRWLGIEIVFGWASEKGKKKTKERDIIHALQAQVSRSHNFKHLISISVHIIPAKSITLLYTTLLGESILCGCEMDTVDKILFITIIILNEVFFILLTNEPTVK